MNPRVPRQPALDARMFVGSVVVADQVQREMRRHPLVEQAQKLEPFLVPVALLAKAIDFAVGRIHRDEQGSGAVAFVVVGHGGAASAFQRQAGLGPIQGLNLALLVHAQHQRVFGRIQVQTNDVFQFLGEGGIVADLKMSGRLKIDNLFFILRISN
jgi:hypothetical protein